MRQPRESASPDRVWLEQLFRDHHAELCSFVYGYTSSDDVAEDIVQDLFLSVWQDPERWVKARRVRVLLFVAARNRALDYLRHRRVRENHAERVLAEDPNPSIPSADDAFAHKEIQQAIDDAVSRLPERAREIFLMSRSDGLTYREIAERIGISIKTVETHMSRSLRRLREQLIGFLTLLTLLLGA